MRPTTSSEIEDWFECLDCGERVEAPDTRECQDCGGRLVNIGKARDL